MEGSRIYATVILGPGARTSDSYDHAGFCHVSVSENEPSFNTLLTFIVDDAKAARELASALLRIAEKKERLDMEIKSDLDLEIARVKDILINGGPDDD